MGNFKEFKNKETLLNDWLPWGALVAPGIILNKDNSMMSTFVYESLVDSENEKVQKAIDGICKLLLSLDGGWVLYSEVVNSRDAEMGVYRNNENKGDDETDPEGVHQIALDKEKDNITKLRNIYYMTLFWLPIKRKQKKDKNEKVIDVNPERRVEFDISKKEEALRLEMDRKLAKFRLILKQVKEYLGELCDLQEAEGVAYLNYLRSTISFDRSKITMPPIPLYLDVLISMDIEMSGKPTLPVIGGYAVKVVSPLGYLGPRANELIKNLNSIGIEYRFVTRFMFFSEEDRKKEEERYTSSWCEGRRSIMDILRYDPSETSLLGYYTSNIVIWDKSEEEIQKKVELLEECIFGMGIPCVVEDYNLKDVWYGTIPGMVRANIKPPMILVNDVSELVVVPSRKTQKKD